MGSGPLVIIGDVLLDRDVDGRASRLCPDGPAPVVEEDTARLRPGGAALAALLAATAEAREVVLIAPFGRDPASISVLAALPDSVSVIRLPLSGPLQEKTRIRASGQTLVRLDKPAGVPQPVTGAAGEAAAAAISSAGAVLVSDYGHGTAADPLLQAALRATRAPLVWDPHPRGAQPVPGTWVATPNSAEATAWAGLGTASAGAGVGARVSAGAAAGTGVSAGAAVGATGAVLAAAEAADRLLATWPVQAVAVTLGSRGALLARSDQAPLAIPAMAVQAGDPCGAGDRFAVAVAAALQDGAMVSEAVTQAVAAASLFLADGGVGGLAERPEPPAPSADRSSGAFPGASSDAFSGVFPSLSSSAEPDALTTVRAAGGVVVAAGGCFDVLHAGHVAMLRAARSLGDCLVVCMNSDESVRRLKGPGRPFNTAADRTAVLTALDCVDRVMIFDENTPERLLAELKPAIWVKGGDYDGRELPEAAVLRRWGGRAVTVPYLAGRSTTRIATAVARLLSAIVSRYTALCPALGVVRLVGRVAPRGRGGRARRVRDRIPSYTTASAGAPSSSPGRPRNSRAVQQAAPRAHQAEGHPQRGGAVRPRSCRAADRARWRHRHALACSMAPSARCAPELSATADARRGSRHRNCPARPDLSQTRSSTGPG